jgi:hypothetical protein
MASLVLSAISHGEVKYLAPLGYQVILKIDFCEMRRQLNDFFSDCANCVVPNGDLVDHTDLLPLADLLFPHELDTLLVPLGSHHEGIWKLGIWSSDLRGIQPDIFIPEMSNMFTQQG